MSLLDALLLEEPTPPTPTAGKPSQHVHIALRADGIRGSGTASDPWNGRTSLTNPLAVTLQISDTTVTATTATPHGYQNHEIVKISGATGTGANYLNATFRISNATATTFQFELTASGVVPAGNPTCSKVIYLFDEMMRAISESSIIHLGVGIFETRGLTAGYNPSDQYTYLGWLSKPGQKIVGAGRDITVLRLMFALPGVNTAVAQTAIAPINVVEGFEVSDLTVDCNIRSQSNELVMKAAVNAPGSHGRIRRVRVIDFGTHIQGGECFVLAVGGGKRLTDGAVDGRIEDCIIEHANSQGVYTRTLFHIAAGEDTTYNIMRFHRGCAIRNCYANGDFVDASVSIVSIAFSDPLATVTTRQPHGRTVGDWVIITGVLENGASSENLNGSFQIAGVPNATSFTLDPDTNPSGVISGEMFVGRYSAHALPVEKIERSGLVATLTSVIPHNRKPGEWVNIIAALGGVHKDEVGFFGRFQISQVLSPFLFEYTLPDPPPVHTSTSHPTVLALNQQALTTTGGSECVAEGNRIFNMPIGGPYNDTFGSKNMTARNNYYSDVIYSLAQGLDRTSPLKQGSSLIHGGSDFKTATFFTQKKHGLSVSAAIVIRGALAPDEVNRMCYANCYNGAGLTVGSVALSGRAFSYLLPTAPYGRVEFPSNTPGAPNDLYDSFGGANAAGSPIFQLTGEDKVKTGSSLIRKTGAATTAVFATILAHGLSVGTGRNVAIQGARIGSSYSNNFNKPRNAKTLITAVSDYAIEYSIGSGTSFDPDASGSPVFSTEQAASSLTRDGLIATFTTALPHGLFKGQIVRVFDSNTVPTASAFYGVFRIIDVSSGGTSFTYQMDSVPSSGAPGTPEFTVFLEISSVGRGFTLKGGVDATNGKYVKVSTSDPHRLQIGDAVSIWGASVDAFNTAFRVEWVIEGGMAFIIGMEVVPATDPTGTIMWATQNSTPLTVKKTTRLTLGTPPDAVDYHLYEGTFTSDKPATSGPLFPVSTAESRSLISLWGASVNGSFVNPYNNVVEVTASDSRSFTFVLLKEVSVFEPPDISLGDPGINAAGAPMCAPAVATPITVEGTTAKFHTVFPHNVYFGRGVRVEDPNPTRATPFNAWFEVRAISDKRSFTWELPSEPGENGPPGYFWAALWQTDRIVFENNVVDLGIHFHPLFEDALLYGINESTAVDINGLVKTSEYTWRQNIFRENLLGLPAGGVAPKATAIIQQGSENEIVENNIIDMPVPAQILDGYGQPLVIPLRDLTSGPATYFNNQTPVGETMPAYRDVYNEAHFIPGTLIGLTPQFQTRTRHETLPEHVEDTVMFTL
jgi:hypothetical protein